MAQAKIFEVASQNAVWIFSIFLVFRHWESRSGFRDVVDGVEVFQFERVIARVKSD